MPTLLEAAKQALRCFDNFKSIMPMEVEARETLRTAIKAEESKLVIPFDELFGDGDAQGIGETAREAVTEHLWHSDTISGLALNEIEDHFDYEIVQHVIVTPKEHVGG